MGHGPGTRCQLCSLCPQQVCIKSSQQPNQIAVGLRWKGMDPTAQRRKQQKRHIQQEKEGVYSLVLFYICSKPCRSGLDSRCNLKKPCCSSNVPERSHHAIPGFLTQQLGNRSHAPPLFSAISLVWWGYSYHAAVIELFLR